MTTATVFRTYINVSSTDSDYRLPGDVSPEDFVSGYATQIQGLGNMQAASTYEDRPGEGRVRVLTFTPRQGTKG